MSSITILRLYLPRKRKPPIRNRKDHVRDRKTILCAGCHFRQLRTDDYSGKWRFQGIRERISGEIRQADAEISSILEAYNRKSNLENRSRIEIPDPDASDKPGT